MHRNTVRYHQLRDLLFSRLGGRKCAKAGMPDIRGDYIECHPDLEVDHVDGREYEVRELGSRQRVRRYLKELDSGVKLQVLCKKHNGNDGYAKGQARSGQHRKQRAQRDRRAARVGRTKEEG